MNSDTFIRGNTRRGSPVIFSDENWISWKSNYSRAFIRKIFLKFSVKCVPSQASERLSRPRVHWKHNAFEDNINEVGNASQWCRRTVDIIMRMNTTRVHRTTLECTLSGLYSSGTLGDSWLNASLPHRELAAAVRKRRKRRRTRAVSTFLFSIHQSNIICI